MSEPGRLWRILVAHHGDEEAHHCYRLPLPGRRRLVCARCLGLYPTLLAVVVFESAVYRFESPDRWLVAFGLVTPAVIDWARVMLFRPRGSNVARTLTGVLAGVGLGVAFTDYFRDTSSGYFWALMATLTLVVGLIWWVRPKLEEDWP